jgi:FtsP/CotA-like multicopper oxidase with cupredoxin domain
MVARIFRPNRRELVSGLAATMIAGPAPWSIAAENRPSLALNARAARLALRPDQPDSPVWSIEGLSGALRFTRGDTLDLRLGNDTAAPMALNWRGIDGVPLIEPLLAQPALAPHSQQSLVIPLRHAGTFMCDIRLLGDGGARPSAARALVVEESQPIAIDREEVLVFEDWRLKPDGVAIAPGTSPDGTAAVFTVNGQRTMDIPARLHERLRLRFINGFQRNVIAVKIENHEVWAMALDGQPSEPFLARNGAVVLAPGGRADVFVDATLAPDATASILLHDGAEARPIGRLVGDKRPPARAAALAPAAPLPANGLPERIDLKGALRIDLPLNGPKPDWVAPAAFAASTTPAFRAKAGRTVVLALSNRADKASAFHLHGHHFRLLDRLDDGWKPFWLDTLAIEPGQTQRVAFVAETAGRWLLEATAVDWAAPRLLRWFVVE